MRGEQRQPGAAKLRQLPAVHRVVGDEAEGPFCEYPRHLVVEAAQRVLERHRSRLLEDTAPESTAVPGVEQVRREVLREIESILRPTLRRVVNGTGVVLHTNLGRAPLGLDARDSLYELAGTYTNLEYDLGEGKRGSRYDHVVELLCRLTGAEDALVVNNNAAAVLLVLSVIARGGEVVVSRGELVEIGGSFRIPDVMVQSGASLVEVGTTNKTRLSDYRRAVSGATRALLKVHTSNYRVVGFTTAVTTEELVALGRNMRVPVIEDLGSGVLVDLERYGLVGEPTVQSVVEAGVDAVTFSGDKLLGGPQAGLILGSSSLIARCREHPLTRALRVDKLTLGALEATLLAYQAGPSGLRSLPVFRMLSYTDSELGERARELAAALQDRYGDRLQIDVHTASSRVGGGALPLSELPTRVVAVRCTDLPTTRLETRLRTLPEVPVIGRIQDDYCLIDVRTLLDNDMELVVDGFATVLEEGGDAGVTG